MTNSSDTWNISKLARIALAIGIGISGLLLAIEAFVPSPAPRAVALPGWMAIIFLWGFEGGRGAWPWIVFTVANAIAYSYVVFLLLVVSGIISRRKKVLTSEPRK
jgi:hypothetical protein